MISHVAIWARGHEDAASVSQTHSWPEDADAGDVNWFHGDAYDLIATAVRMWTLAPEGPRGAHDRLTAKTLAEQFPGEIQNFQQFVC